MVLLHRDFSACNIMVDRISCHLTGIIDWAEAEICPFGQNLDSLQAITGTLHLKKWVEAIRRLRGSAGHLLEHISRRGGRLICRDYEDHQDSKDYRLTAVPWLHETACKYAAAHSHL